MCMQENTTDIVNQHLCDKSCQVCIATCLDCSCQTSTSVMFFLAAGKAQSCLCKPPLYTKSKGTKHKSKSKSKGTEPDETKANF